MARKKKNIVYTNGGDEMFFYHKKTGHPAKQLSHTKKTWTNRRYTHSPNRIKDYELDFDDFNEEDGIYKTKRVFIDIIYTRGRIYDMTQYKKRMKKTKKR